VGVGGFVPYPDTFSFYKDDLWFYNITNGLWTEVVPLSTANPDGRRFIMILKYFMILK
jgi:hypothetical protein